MLRRQADQAQQLGDALAAPAGREAVQRQRLAERLLDRHARIERRVRVLEDDLQRAPCARIASASSANKLFAVEAARCPPSARSGAAPAGPVVDLPQPDSPTSASVSPARELEIDAVDRVHDAVLAAEQTACAPGSA